MRIDIKETRIGLRVLCALLAVALVGAGGWTRAAADEPGVFIDLGAALREGANTVAISGDGRVGFTAAYGVPESGDTSANQVYSFDTTTGAIIDSMPLSGFYPRQVVYSDANGYVAVRHAGSEYDEDGQFFDTARIDVLTTSMPRDRTGAGGEFALRFDFPVWDPWSLREGVYEAARDALDDLAFTSDGRLLFYSNAVDMFAHDTQSGFTVSVPAINAYLDWDAGDQIAFFTYTPTSALAANGAPVGYLSIGVNRDVETPDDPATPADEYTLTANARVLNFKVWWDPGQSASTGVQYLSSVSLGADGLSEGSNVYIDPNGRWGDVAAVDTGTLYTYRVETGLIRRTTTLEGFGSRPNDPSSRGPRRISTAADGRSIVISRPGNISRPTNVNRDISRPTNRDISRPTNRDISRPTNIVESPAFALGVVSERGGRVSVVANIPSFDGNEAITNAVFDSAGANAYFATADGLLHGVSVATGEESTVGLLGAGVWTLAIHAETGQIAGVVAMQSDEDGNVIDDGGISLFTVGAAAKSAAGKRSFAPKVGVGTVEISRPCGTSGAHSSTERVE
jgi:hypothetical protein